MKLSSGCHIRQKVIRQYSGKKPKLLFEPYKKLFVTIYFTALSGGFNTIECVRLLKDLFIKNRTQLTRVLLLGLVRFFMNRSLLCNIRKHFLFSLMERICFIGLIILDPIIHSGNLKVARSVMKRTLLYFKKE